MYNSIEQGERKCFPITKNIIHLDVTQWQRKKFKILKVLNSKVEENATILEPFPKRKKKKRTDKIYIKKCRMSNIG